MCACARACVCVRAYVLLIISLCLYGFVFFIHSTHARVIGAGVPEVGGDEGCRGTETARDVGVHPRSALLHQLCTGTNNCTGTECTLPALLIMYVLVPILLPLVVSNLLLLASTFVVCLFLFCLGTFLFL